MDSARTVRDLLDDLQRLLGRHKVGEQVHLQVVRDGTSREVAVTLEEVQ